MSERDLKRVEVLSEVESGRRSRAAAASLLGVSERQLYKLMARYRADGGSGLVHKARGRTSNRSINSGIRQYAIDLVVPLCGLWTEIGDGSLGTAAWDPGWSRDAP